MTRPMIKGGDVHRYLQRLLQDDAERNEFMASQAAALEDAERREANYRYIVEDLNRLRERDAAEIERLKNRLRAAGVQP